ncbi:MAG: chitobiase/beta-hexosaminidase C-terminal domain-containing protein, partial [Akkermansiaceae bacterium]|nr:chitobiase/beta-hexosaminidase C-terminal domain-containing protein [Akkermansiaceae bacterium]
ALGNLDGLTEAITLSTLPTSDPRILSSTSQLMPTLNLLGDGGDGNYEFNQVPPGNGGDDYLIVATGILTIPTAGVYTFGINSDDGSRLRIGSTVVIYDDTYHGPEDRFGTISLTAGQHSFEVIMFEGGGGDSVEFFAAPGNLSAFNPALFRLVGDTANGGLSARTALAGTGGEVGTDLTTPMTNRNSAYFRMPFSSTGPGSATCLYLLMRYNDGFSAWLNGNAAASANAPAVPAWNSASTASRTNEQALARVPFNLTGQLGQLVNGTNTLAIHGMRSSTSDGTFLILPELISGSINPSSTPAYYGDGLATPGWINGAPSSLGNVEDTQFSVNRGIHTSPFTVSITSATPGAIIRYTTDGSTPSADNGITYVNPLLISGTTVLRAMAYIPGWRATDVDTHTYLFPNDIIRQSANGAPPPGWPASSGTDQVLDFGMDPDIVDHPDPAIGGPEVVKSALLAIPSVSITTDLRNLLNIGDSQGIYSNPYERGFAWERPASFEWINPPNAANPNGRDEFQINAGLRLRGGFSRSTDNPKHSFRLFFRQEYGDTKLRYPLFGRDAAQEFDQIDLRTSQNYAWSFGGDDQNTFLREESCRQAQLDMGHPGSHVRYFHLATDGNLAAWQSLWNQANDHAATPTNQNYFRMMGRAADGVTPNGFPVLLDPDNLIDYLLLTFWSGNLDGSVSAFLGNERANNWFASRRRVNNPGEGFKFFVHDFEHSLFDVNEDRTGPFNSLSEPLFAYSNPLFLHNDLVANAEYRMRWADRIQKHLFNQGALTPAAWQNRVNRFAAIVDASIIAESARWGDSAGWVLRTKADWVNAQNNLISYFTPRNAIVLDQLRADNLYPSINAPVMSPAGGYQPDGVEIAVSGPEGATLYYMPDGSDPRAVGGALRAGALTYVSSTVEQTLIANSSSGWKYLGNGSNPGPAWRTTGFADQTWPGGTTEIGYGDGDENTIIPIVDANPAEPGIQKVPTTYFRRSFQVANVNEITGLSVTVEFDDSYAVYLNGTRVGGNVPVDAAHGEYHGDTIEDEVETFSIPHGLLQNGGNVIAVEVRQANENSSDLSMNLSLTATRSNSSTPLILTGTGERVLRFRARSGSEWSALAESIYQIGTAAPSPANLVVSEISYFPPAPHGNAEFIELLNEGNQTLNLAGARFTEGIDFTFPPGSLLAPGARVLVVREIAAFEVLYGTGKPIAGVFANGTALNNAGERIRLESAEGATLLDFTYTAAFPWPARANGLGRSMVYGGGNPAEAGSWRPSASAPGNPGNTDAFTRSPGQGLLEYALAGSPATWDRSSSLFSIKRRLGADDADLVPQWSTDLVNWQEHSLTPWADVPDESGNSELQWKLDPAPQDGVFLRVRVQD